MALIKIGDKWQFGNEFELEEIVWKNLPRLLNLKPFKRQFQIRGQICDILALDDQQRLVVIELKNVEDRYVAQQLTRYYNALKEYASFEEVDLEQPIRLIAITPSFHQDTLTDCKYSVLDIELMSFQLEAKADCLYLELIGAREGTITPLLIQQESISLQTAIPIPEPPRKLLNWLSHASDAEFNATMMLREKVLGFDKRIKEIIEPQRIVYGRGITKPCCELKKTGAFGFTDSELARFFWLPHPGGKPPVLRMMIGTDKSEQSVTGLLYCPKSSRSKDLWRFPGLNHGIGNYSKIPDVYKPFLDKEMNCSLSNLVDLALQTWQQRFQ
ncbi:DUF91 domain-containing protein [Nodosilinea sp. FACHB-131]|uniref:endonuclease NucS domain-containing protein n=1 Tax=Cyanophyceae TaxID=3028117 RepID=UPI001681D958|nr:endonuclease NucS domain-containing protein [Nodosilinea sp. FACHB-131]MBD1876985.1 DUF91 domain-containing protein [Nodosilinea sp. FACHB-131]